MRSTLPKPVTSAQSKRACISSSKKKKIINLLFITTFDEKGIARLSLSKQTTSRFIILSLYCIYLYSLLDNIKRKYIYVYTHK